MSNIISLADLLGTKETIHTFTLNGRTIRYRNPTLESLPDVLAFSRGGTSYATIASAARGMLEAAEFEEGSFDEGWFSGIPYGQYLDFLAFIGNPDAEREPTEVSQPFTLEVRGLQVTFAAPMMGDFEAFAEFLNAGEVTPIGFALHRRDRLFAKATLPDGEPAPLAFVKKLSMQEVEALTDYWLSRQLPSEDDDEGNAKAAPKTKRGTGKKPRPSSAITTATASSETTPDTSESSPSDN